MSADLGTYVRPLTVQPPDLSVTVRLSDVFAIVRSDRNDGELFRSQTEREVAIALLRGAIRLLEEADHA